MSTISPEHKELDLVGQKLSIVRGAREDLGRLEAQLVARKVEVEKVIATGGHLAHLITYPEVDAAVALAAEIRKKCGYDR